MFEVVRAGEVLVLQAKCLIGGGAFAVRGADEINPMQPLLLIGEDERGGFRGELRAEVVEVGGNLGVERGEAGVGADDFFARSLA